MLRSKMLKLRQKIEAIEEKREKSIGRKLIGKCFKFHNSYSGNERWWLYITITGMGRGTFCDAFQFETTSQGEHQTKVKNWFSHASAQTGSGYLPCSRVEFDAAWSDFKKSINSIKF